MLDKEFNATIELDQAAKSSKDASLNHKETIDSNSEIESGKIEHDNTPVPPDEEIEPHVSAKTWTVAAV